MHHCDRRSPAADDQEVADELVLHDWVLAEVAEEAKVVDAARLELEFVLGLAKVVGAARAISEKGRRELF